MQVIRIYEIRNPIRDDSGAECGSKDLKQYSKKISKDLVYFDYAKNPKLPNNLWLIYFTDVTNEKFIKPNELKDYVIIGNSLGGHIGLYYTKLFNKAKGLVLTGSSGLYESAMGSGYTKRGDYNVIRKKVEEVFFDPKVATKSLVDEIYETVNNRNKLIRILAYAKSAIRHNMSKDLPKIKTPTCLIWGKNDIVTPPNVAEEFHKLLPNSDLFWINKCGHAAMMEHPIEFNNTVLHWLSERNLNTIN